MQTRNLLRQTWNQCLPNNSIGGGAPGPNQYPMSEFNTRQDNAHSETYLTQVANGRNGKEEEEE